MREEKAVVIKEDNGENFHTWGWACWQRALHHMLVLRYPLGSIVHHMLRHVLTNTMGV